MNYDSIGKKIVMRADLSSLSGRDKVSLFRELMDDLKITEAFQVYPDETAKAQELIIERFTAVWK